MNGAIIVDYAGIDAHLIASRPVAEVIAYDEQITYLEQQIEQAPNNPFLSQVKGACERARRILIRECGA